MATFTHAQIDLIKTLIANDTGIAANFAVDRASMDNAWLVLGGALVFFMHSGFALLEVGSVRNFNEKSILFKNAVSPTFAALLFWFVGWPLAFGGDEVGGFAGGNFGYFLSGPEQFDVEITTAMLLSDDAPSGMNYNGNTYGSWFFQWAFCATCSTIVSGAVAERIPYNLYMYITFFLTGIIYPIVVHWLWGGGWANEWGVYDFAGSGVVHMCGGVAALVCAIVVGPRHGRFVDQTWLKDEDQNDEDCGAWYTQGRQLPVPGTARDSWFKFVPADVHSSPTATARMVLGCYVPISTLGSYSDLAETEESLTCATVTRSWTNEMTPQSPVFQTLGVFILWFGWYGFNCASTLGISGDFGGQAAKVAVITTLGAASGGLSSMLLTLAMGGGTDLGSMTNGILAGLVGITGPCAMIEPWAAVVIGFTAGGIFLGATALLEKLKIDDVVLAVPVHFFCGMWGVICVGLFSSPRNFAAAFGANTCGVFYGCANGGTQLGVQLGFILAIIGWTATTITAILMFAKYVLQMKMCYTVEEQMGGTDYKYDAGLSPKSLSTASMSPRGKKSTSQVEVVQRSVP